MATREASDGNFIILAESLRFFEEELEPLLRMEDQAVLPPLEAAIGRYGTLVNVIAYEHDEIRRGIGKYREALDDLHKQPASWAAIQELNRHGIFLVQFLWDHFRKERVSLFAVARERLSPRDLDAIRKQITH
jgi:hemerythrin-like domain-containing protein